MADITWSLVVLTFLSLPRSAENVSALHAWADSEGMPDWAHNWLGSHLATSTSRQYDATGVQGYSTFDHGIEATVATLREARFAGILAALRANAGYQAIWHAINVSPWRPKAQAGRYPVQLYELIADPSKAITAPTPSSAASQLYDWSTHVRESGGALSASASRASRTSAAIRGLSR